MAPFLVLSAPSPGGLQEPLLKGAPWARRGVLFGDILVLPAPSPGVLREPLLKGAPWARRGVLFGHIFGGLSAIYRRSPGAPLKKRTLGAVGCPFWPHFWCSQRHPPVVSRSPSKKAVGGVLFGRICSQRRLARVSRSPPKEACPPKEGVFFGPGLGAAAR